MAYWVKCTSSGERAVPVYLNLDAMLIITRQRGGSIVVYAGSLGDTINEANVTETPEEIFALPRVEYGAPPSSDGNLPSKTAARKARASRTDADGHSTRLEK